MKRGSFFVVMVVASAVTAVHAADDEDTQAATQIKSLTFSGYLRAGTGINLRGGTQVCFKLPAADTKYRLGNECDYVIEPHFDAKVASYEGSDWHVHVTPSVYRAWGETEFVKHQEPIGNAPNSPNTDTDSLVTRFQQAYVYGKKIPALGGGTVWAGRRDVEQGGGLRLKITDHLLEDIYGDGFGVDDIRTRMGLLTARFLLNPRDDANNSRYRLPIRLTGMKNVPSGELSLYFAVSGQLKSRDQDTNVTPAKSPNGIALGVYQALKGTIFGGETLLGFRYDKDHEFDIIDALGSLTPTENTRFLIQHGGALSRETAYYLLAQYRLKTKLGVDSKWLSIGGRTDTRISGPYRVLVEVGHDQVKPGDGTATQTMTKFTLAGAVSAGKETWSRPTLRLFATHAIWNDAARAVFNQGWVNEARVKQIYGDKKSGTSIGVQAETWW